MIVDYKDTLEIGIYWYVPFAAGGAGESVYISSRMQTEYHTTIDTMGGYHTITHSNFMGVTGVGMATGGRYAAAGRGVE